MYKMQALRYRVEFLSGAHVMNESGDDENGGDMFEKYFPQQFESFSKRVAWPDNPNIR